MDKQENQSNTVSGQASTNTDGNQNLPQDPLQQNQTKSKKPLFIVVAIVLALAIAGLIAWLLLANQNSNSSTTSTDTSSTTNNEPSQKVTDSNTSSSQATGTIITTGSSEFGTMLFNEKNQAIYIWELEESSKAECYGDCAKAWPPVLTDGAPQASGEVKGDLLGTTKRNDGSTQVTYNGHPLYYYANEDPGEVKCHNIVTHGGLWWVIQPNGNRAN